MKVDNRCSVFDLKWAFNTKPQTEAAVEYFSAVLTLRRSPFRSAERDRVWGSELEKESESDKKDMQHLRGGGAANAGYRLAYEDSRWILNRSHEQESTQQEDPFVL